MEDISSLQHSCIWDLQCIALNTNMGVWVLPAQTLNPEA